MKKAGKIRWQGVMTERHTKQREAILYSIFTFAGSQWRVLSSGVALTCLSL